MVHGHLTPYNILIDKNKNIVLSDYYFQALRKKMVYSQEYIMWGQYSAPEILASDRITRFNNHSDIYSLGVIFWEMLAQIEPFGGQPMEKLNDVVGVKKLRPKINVDVWTNQIVDLVNSCWSDDLMVRPTSAALKQTVDELIDEYE